MARCVREGIGVIPVVIWEPEEEDSDENDDSEVSGFGDPDEDNFSNENDYVDPIITQMFEK